MKKYWICIVLILPLLTGCENLTGKYSLWGMITGKGKKAETQAPAKPILPQVEDVSLAKIIIKPPKHPIDVKRDPFRPIVTRRVQRNATVSQSQPVVQVDPFMMARQMDFLGVVMINGQYSALINDSEKKGVYSINDKVQGLKIVNIAETEVVFKKDDQTFVLKRGEQ